MATPASKKKTTRPSTRSGRPSPELLFGDFWEYDPSPETADPKLKPRYELFIDGQFVPPAGGKYFDSINPANEQKLAELEEQRVRLLPTRWRRVPRRVLVLSRRCRRKAGSSPG